MTERPSDFYEQRLSLEARGVAPAETLTRLLDYYALVAGWRTSAPAADAWDRALRRYYAEVHGLVRSAVIHCAPEPQPYWATLAWIRVLARRGDRPRSVYARALADIAVLNIGWPATPYFSVLARPDGETDAERVARRAVLVP